MAENKFKIGIIQQSPDMGGAESYMLSLIREFKKKDCEIYFASNKGKFYNYGKKISDKYSEIPFVLDVIGNYKGLIKSIVLTPFAIVFYIKLLFFYRKSGINIILMSGFSEKMLVTALSPLFGIPVAWIEYSRLRVVFERNFSIPRRLYLKFQNITQKIIVPTKYTKKGLVEEGVKVEKIVVLPLGVNISYTVNNKKGNSEFIIGNVSRLTREKGQQILINAMPEILKSIPKAKLLLIGHGPDKYYFKSLIRKLKLTKNVELKGYVKNLDELYKKMSVFVFPTIWNLEGFGLVTIEAMSKKIPVVASDSYPVKEVVGKSGLLFKVGDSVDLAAKIIMLYKNNNLRKRIAEEGFKKTQEIYNIEKNAAKLLDILKKSTL